MIFKDRLNLLNNNQKDDISNTEIGVKENSNVLDFFVSDKITEKIITDSINNSESVIIIGSVDCDNTILCNYIETYLQKKGNNKVANFDIKNFVKIIENTIYGYKGFIIPLNIKEYDNFIENLKLLILINFPNINETLADKIIEKLGAIVIFFSKNQDGLFYVHNIGKITKKQNRIFLDDIYNINKKNAEPQETTLKREISSKKVNKYKLLKEKIKKHDNIDL